MTRDINLVLLISAFAQVAAFLKSILIAYFFGVSPELDGYFLAQVLPGIVTGTAIGVLQSSFVPTYIRLKSEGRVDAAAAMAGRLVQILAVAGFVLSATVALFAAQIVQLCAPLADPAVAAAATYSLRVLSLLLLFNSLADFLALLLNAELRFAIAALAPIANALVASLFLLLAPDLGLANLVWGTLLGLATQVALLAFSSLRLPVRLGVGSLGPENPLRAVGRLSLSALPAVVVANIAASLPSLLAATLGPGAVSAFSYAWKLNLAATQAAGIALGTVMLPHFSDMLARSDLTSIQRVLRRMVPLIFAIGGVALVWIWVAGEPFLRFAFERGRFSESDVQAVHRLWLLMALGLAPSLASIALAKLIQAASSFALLAWFGLGGVAVVVLVNLLLAPSRGVDGLAIAVCASAWAVFVLCTLGIRRYKPSGLKPLGVRALSPLMIAFAVTSFSMALLRLLPDPSDISVVLIATLIAAVGTVLLVRSR
jgi:putative peptidoglycan lipid II flippase